MNMLNVLDECECFHYIIACLYLCVCFIFHAFYYDVHGARFPGHLVVGSRPLRRAEGQGRDRLVSVLKVVSLGLYGP